ncbi:hypothetical protein TL16_g11903 [Triparma laevis f. inornata]|uniref:RING-type E3 ubiquitin transferase n=1 Tax=Triparma laevis f. inornata TaxID=1714386 RepID=A0A9W7ES84_9STRA|nr:hypothetical protein TL16_g11903 [Triparma laevis f. inornata]
MSFPSTSAYPKDAGLLIPVGMKLRDEFLCPITRLLITDPVIASDGHTYDRTAIERWLKTHSNSPKTGETLKTKDLTPNITLKRLLQDLLTSKSDALFCEDVGSGDVVMQRVYLVKEDVLVLKCLGPVESQWNGKSFRTTVTGCIGGRRRPKEEKTGRDFIQFSDATVSRRHFEIKYSDSKFYISDLGSAGGTFIRVVKESSVRVKRGMMVMKVKGKEGKKNTQTHPLQQFSNPSIDYDSTEEKDDTQTHTTPNNAINPTPSLETEENYLFPGPDPNLSVKCFAPEGTPIQGKIYEVGRTGATLGRKTCNTISFSQTGETGETVGLDSSISGEVSDGERTATEI